MRTTINIMRIMMLGLIIATFFTGIVEAEIVLPISLMCLIVMVVYMAGSILSRYLPYSWACDWAGTHFPSPKGYFDGCSLHSVCSKCDKEIMQDGQGNWF